MAQKPTIVCLVMLSACLACVPFPASGQELTTHPTPPRTSYNARATESIEQGDPASALLWIAAALDENDRDVMLRYRAGNLMRQAPVLLHVLTHEKSVNVVQFSPDGRWILTAGDDHAAQLWDRAAGKAAAPPLQHTGSVLYACFNTDGKYVGRTHR